MDKKTAYTNLILCSVIHGINHYLVIFYKPLYPAISEFFSLQNVADLTTRLTLIYASYGISNFLSGLLAKKFSLKKILFLGTLLMSLASMSVIFISKTDYLFFIILIFLMGLGGGVYHPIANTLITSSFEGKPGQVIGILSIGSSTGFILAPFIGEYFGTMLGFKKLFFLSGSLSLIVSLIFLIYAKDNSQINKTTTENNNSHKKKTLSFGRILILAIIYMCIPLTIRETIGWSYYEITPFWVKYGFSYGITIGIIQTMQYLPGILVQPLTGMLCDVFKPIRMTVFTLLLTGAGILLFAVSHPLVLWFALIMFGAGMSASTVASETYMASLVTSKDRPLVYGIVLSTALGLGGLTAGFSGKVVDFFGKEMITGYRFWFLLVGSLMIISISVYFFIEKLRKKAG